jgi:hypothetical protein
MASDNASRKTAVSVVRMRPDKVDEPGKIGCHRFVLTRQRDSSPLAARP